MHSKGGEWMYAKSLVFGIATVIFLLPAASYGQRSPTTSDVVNGSIVIISQEETDVPGYVHTTYAFVDLGCGAQIVDHYGTSINPNDKELLLSEQRMCTELSQESRDGD
jgi:hypothetical protein